MRKRKKKYLNNKDLLKEIHLSKISFCSFLDRNTDSQEDIITLTISEIFEDRAVPCGKDENDEVIFEDIPVIKLAQKARAKRLNEASEEIISPENIPITDLVFRVMTNEHIPLVKKKKSKAERIKAAKRAKSKAIFNELLDNSPENATTTSPSPDDIMIPMKCNFAPFYHYRLDEDNTPYLIGKSHWKGELISGEFSLNEGRITENLGRMFLKLVERYGSRGNWTSYSYKDEMQGQSLLQLSYVGLQFNEYRSQNPFGYFSMVLERAFTGIFNTEKRVQTIRDDVLEVHGLTPSWTRQMVNDSRLPGTPIDYYKFKKKK